MTNALRTPDLDAIRAVFPALAGETVFLENAGGSQVPACVADAVRDYMRDTYVQLGAGYRLSNRASRVVDDAHAWIRRFVNGDGVGEVVLGSSASVLCRWLADAYGDVLGPGDEIVVAESGHEANVGPWLKLERQGVRIRWWRVDPETGASKLDALSAVLGEHTKIVAFPHVSNLLGAVDDVEAVTRLAHDAGARVVVDGVAFAPHRAVDVAAWGVDFYVYSTYKVYGPHMAALFGRTDAFAELVGPNHFFVPDDEVPYKWELGGVSHEGCAGLLALREYVCFLTGRETADRATVEAAAARWEALEAPPVARLVEYLLDHPRVRIVGPQHAGPDRVGTVSFLHASKSSKEVALAVNRKGVGIRHGHMYAHRLCTALGLDPEDGVVRVSLVHYNSPADIDRLLQVLDDVM